MFQQRAMPLFRLLSAVAIFLALTAAATPVQASTGCVFRLGFLQIFEMIASQVGNCVTNETYNPLTGDSLQYTTGGLLVWRKADNWTAFTDGYRTYVNGPNGLARRLNSQRFSWEANPTGLPVVRLGDILNGSAPPPPPSLCVILGNCGQVDNGPPPASPGSCDVYAPGSFQAEVTFTVLFQQSFSAHQVCQSFANNVQRWLPNFLMQLANEHGVICDLTVGSIADLAKAIPGAPELGKICVLFSTPTAFTFQVVDGGKPDPGKPLVCKGVTRVLSDTAFYAVYDTGSQAIGNEICTSVVKGLQYEAPPP